MGMSSSQARLLTLTARMHDVEYKAQNVQAKKVALATEQDAIYQKYCDALDATKVQVAFRNETGTFRYVDGCYNTVAKYQEGRVRQYALMDAKSGKVWLDRDTIKCIDECTCAQDFIDANVDYSEYEDNIAAQEAKVNEAQDNYDKIASETHEKTTTLTDETNSSSNIQTNSSTVKGYDVSATVVITDHRYSDPGNTGEYGFSYTSSNTDQKAAEAEAEIAAYCEYETKFQSSPDVDISVINIKSTAIIDETNTNGTTNTTTETTDEELNPDYEDWLERKAAAAETLAEENETLEGYITAFENYKKNDMEYNYYQNLWDLIQEYGYQELDANFVTGDDAYTWFNNMVEAGAVTIKEYVPSGTNKGWTDTDVATSVNDNYLQEVEDETYVKKAEAEYEHELSIINAKDKEYDNTLSKLETEEQSIQAEMDSVTKARDDNEERTFGIFG